MGSPTKNEAPRNERAARAVKRRLTWSGGVAHGFPEADRADVEFWFAATPQERVRGVTELVYELLQWTESDGPAPRLQDLLAEFASERVEAAVVGGYAVAFHGRPRSTKDIDVLLEPDPSNLKRAATALAAFGAPKVVVDGVAALAPDDIVYLGQPPLRIDLMRRIDGVSTEQVMANSVSADFDGVLVRVIGLADLIANKLASGRPQDLIDAEYLERVRAQSESR